MQIINIYTHPTHGRCYLWDAASMNYRLGTDSKTFMFFDGCTIDEVIPKIEAKGFTLVPWNWKAQ